MGGRGGAATRQEGMPPRGREGGAGREEGRRARACKGARRVGTGAGRGGRTAWVARAAEQAPFRELACCELHANCGHSTPGELDELPQAAATSAISRQTALRMHARALEVISRAIGRWVVGVEMQAVDRLRSRCGVLSVAVRAVLTRTQTTTKMPL